jgi:hypothetical protein
MKSIAFLLAGALALGAGCTADTGSEDDDLTSITARERQLSFEGYVYVGTSASQKQIVEAVKRQTRSAFGALLGANVIAGTRELGNIDVGTFRKEVVDVVGGSTAKALRVRYRYTDRAVVPKSMAAHSSLALGLLHGDYDAQEARVMKECTTNDAEAREMAGDVWYVFNPALTRCKKAMNAEQGAIDKARTAAGATNKQVVAAELDRLYIPMTASLAATPESGKVAYPEYDRLFSGGVAPGALVITLMTGLIDHDAPGKTHRPGDDSGYFETLDTLGEVFAARPKMKLVASDPPTDFSTFTVNGKKLTGLGFDDFIRWGVWGDSWPTGLTAADKKELNNLVAERLMGRWVTFEEPLTVKIGTAAPKKVTARLQVFFGAEEEVAPYRRAIRTSDVFVYNGHSYIGEGPLDPANFSAKDFPSSYQLFFIDSCISFNYYDKDYWSFKTRGTQDLDMIVNGTESNSDGAGAAQGRFIAALIGGKQPSYLELLRTAETTGTDYTWGKDALRVVDGELDNLYRPTAKPIKITSP